ncbi:MAG TPA: radical SAM protein [Candidatus Polarisedimenticolia bacterium]|nr:radical SAM protein [Candidatus Polarisedimenticolia bacterium]
MGTNGANGRETFELILIKPSHYDDDGYPIQWKRTYTPSNSLAALYGIAQTCIERRVLGPHVDIRLTVRDEVVSRIVVPKIAQQIRQAGGRGLVCLVGVQSNQYPRAVDLARAFRAQGIQACIGGFHAAGSLAMLPEPQPEIREAWAFGISIFSGEAEGHLDELLLDAWRGTLKPLYDYRTDLQNLDGAPTPFLPHDAVSHVYGLSSFDAGRGCPFECSFCTIINVQGRKSRHRSADDIEAIIRANQAQGVFHFFITDDNFARNRNWEAIVDRLIALRAEGMKMRLTIQVDTLCHRVPGFIEKCGKAGVERVFIGLETVAPDNLAAAKKRQNLITEYRTMLQAWKSIGVVIMCGYILGFPHDTPERIKRDIELIKRELPVDMLEFFILTPLPGSEDHQILHRKGIAMDPDLNNYDTEHVTTAHPVMTAEEWRGAYRDAWLNYYDPAHVETLVRRAVACGIPATKITAAVLRFFGSVTVEGVHPLQAGFLRRKYRRDRRPTLPRESPLVFYPRYAWETLSKQTRLYFMGRRFAKIRQRVESDPAAKAYRDLALTPVTEAETETLELYSATESAKQAVEKAKRKRANALPLPDPATAISAAATEQAALQE